MPSARQGDAAPAKKKAATSKTKGKGNDAKPGADGSDKDAAGDGFSRGVGGAGAVFVTGREGPRARLRFGAAGPPQVEGEIRQGGRLTVEVAPARIQAWQGADALGTVSVRVTFGPRHEQVERGCLELERMGGRPTGRLRPSPATMEVPQDSQSVELVFLMDGAPCEAPHAFPVRPPLPPAR